MSTSKDAPKSRGIPATQNDQAIKEAFSKAVDAHHASHGIPAKTAAENQKRALKIMRSIRNKDK